MILSKFLDSLADHKLLVLGIGIPLGAALAYTALKPTSAKSEVQLTGRHRVVRIHVPRGKIGAVIGQSGNVIRGVSV